MSAHRANPLAGLEIDRLADRRRDNGWYADALSAPTARFLPVGTRGHLADADTQSRVVSLSADEARPLFSLVIPPVLLGELGDTVYFALPLDAESESGFDPPGFKSLRTLGMILAAQDAALLAYASAIVQWHRRHLHCGVCGSETTSEQSGHLRVCVDASCGHNCFPRLDPAIIVLVHDDERCLLGRQPSWPAGTYSTIAGFVEPGESLEDAVMREVDEESGVDVEPRVINYHSSQPWPFPSSLMVGFHARPKTYDIELRDGELEDARWFTREQIENGEPLLSPPVSIAFQLIAHWFDAGDTGRLAALREGRSGFRR